MGYKKSEISTAQIIDSAIKVLAEQGYASTSLLDIAKAAGMSKGAVHYHYPAKDMLIRKVLEHACRKVNEQAYETLPETSNPLEALKLGVGVLWELRVNFSPEAAVIADLIAQSRYDENLREPLAEYYKTAAELMGEFVEANLQDLGFKPRFGWPMTCRMITGFLDGLAWQRLVDENAISSEDAIAAVETFAAGLAMPAISG